MRQFSFPRMRTALVALCSMSLLAVVLVYTQHVSAIDQDILKLNRIVQTNKVNTAATMIFKEGRDMIEAQNWSKAAQKFNEFIKGYPKEKDVDAALYWYGYALQKQGLKEDAATPLRRFCSSREIPNFSKVFLSSGSISSRLPGFIFCFGAE